MLFEEGEGREFEWTNTSADVAFSVSPDGSRVIAVLKGGDLDPAFPAAAAAPHAYDVSSGTPELVSLLPDGAPSPCGAVIDATGKLTGNSIRGGLHNTLASNWVAAESLLYFLADECSVERLYVRDLEAGETTGPLPGSLVKALPGAAFLATTQNLDPARDADDGGNDVYRYDLAGEELRCLTCLGGASARVAGSGPEQIAVAEDGARVYFSTEAPLLPGGGTYRLRVADGDLANVPGLPTDDGVKFVNFSDDGSEIAFSSAAGALDPLGGAATNAGTVQYYLYDDSDGSLTCVSCPRDGSAPRSGVADPLTNTITTHGQPGSRALARDGGTFAFRTATALVNSDQNTAKEGSDPEVGTDIYEYRDGRLALITDGLSQWSVWVPTVEGISADGRDVFFAAASRYTADALESSRRLYDARIGGGIDLPVPLVPCPLEACQGTPQGAPDDPDPASRSFRGFGNLPPGPPNCLAPARRAKRLGRQARRFSLRAKRMRQLATRSSSARRDRIVLRRSRRLASQAKRRAAVAKRLRVKSRRCRTANRARRVAR